jgi:hypothetical protein
MSRWNLLVNGLHQPESSLLFFPRHSAPSQPLKAVRGFYVPTHRLGCSWPAELRVKAAETILGKGIPLLG